MVPTHVSSPKVASSFFYTSSTKRYCNPPVRGRLYFETLEPRTLLAGDMAEITGSVLNDLQGDGNLTAEVGVAGVTVDLYRDGGNGIFDRGGGDDMVATHGTTTDASGRYAFSQLEKGTYFVQFTPPGEFQVRSGADVKTVVITATEAEGVTGRLIDGFSTAQRAEAFPPLASGATSSMEDTKVLGGQRDLLVQITEGDDPFSEVALQSGAGLLRLASDTMVTGNARVVWDGVDDNAAEVNPAGLGGVDLTKFEGNTMTGVSLTVGADHPNTLVKLKVYSDAHNWSEYMTTVPESQGGAAIKRAIFLFAEDPVAQSGSGANFSDVGAVELNFEGVSAVDGQVSVIELVGLTNRRADFTVYNRMSLGDLVWGELVNDGLNKDGETGLAGVKLNLFDDANRDEELTRGVDELLATATTSSDGTFLFDDLFPGKYIVQVPPDNFVPGKPLHRLQSSTGNKIAADPDNDVNGDDNGGPVTDHGVLSRAVTLVANHEPTDDGDQDPNSNLTVDFGFFGFDLALVKSVEETVAVPGNQLNFSVVITNTGLSTAENVSFRDTLPVEVKFVAGQTSSGFSLTPDSQGIVSADLGDLPSDESVTVHVVVDVLQGTTGQVKNIAEVVATGELDTSNNRDEVMVPIEPKIDLAVVKRDTVDPVEPGGMLSYTLRAENHGPSDATGVMVYDRLPEGVAFRSASPKESLIVDGQVEFELGDLAAGETEEFTVNVVVHESTSGTLLNEAWISGNEPETRLDNNRDQASTTVYIEPASVSGVVFLDRNDNGELEPSESRIPDVRVTIVGTDFRDQSVEQTTTTASDGTYEFSDLMPGNYRIIETQPETFWGRPVLDGKDQIGENGDGVISALDGLIAPDLNANDKQDSDAFEGITLSAGFSGTNYNFGELVTQLTKWDFVYAIRY
jgi:uncharacterized repeat protein (TIGR01451 family)